MRPSLFQLSSFKPLPSLFQASSNFCIQSAFPRGQMEPDLTASPYYLQAVTSLLRLVQSPRFTCILLEEEQNLIHRFLSLSTAAQKLWTRLWMRKKDKIFPLIHLQISYSKEIEGLSEALSECCKQNFVHPVQEPEFLLRSFSLEQLKAIYTKLFPQDRTPKGKREALMHTILSNPPKKRQSTLNFTASGTIQLANRKINSLLQIIEETFGLFYAVKPEVQESFVLLCQLALGSFGKGADSVAELMEQSVLVHLGRITFPKVEPLAEFSLFADRKQLNAYIEARKRLKEYAELFQQDENAFLIAFEQLEPNELKEFASEFNGIPTNPFPIPPLTNSSWKVRYTPEYTTTKIWSLYAHALERTKQFPKAAQVYCSLLRQSHNTFKREEWWERLIVISSRHLKAPKDQLLLLCENALKEQALLPAYFVSDLHRRMAKLHKQKPVPLDFSQVTLSIPHTLYPSNSTLQRVILSNQKGATFTVENWALEQHYAVHSTGCWMGIHCESSILSTVAVLLVWNVLFVQGETFQSPFQTCPLDFYSPCFWHSKSEGISQLLSQFTNESASMALCTAHAQHFGINAVGVNWSVPLEACVAFVEGIPISSLRKLILHLLSNYARNLAGFPDLFLWRPKEDGVVEYLLVEVKSENDKLSSKQMLWIELFLELGMNFEVLKVKRE